MVGEGNGCLKAQEAVPAFEAAFDGAADVAGMSALSLVIISGRLRTPAGREGGDAVAAGFGGVAGHYPCLAGGGEKPRRGCATPRGATTPRHRWAVGSGGQRVPSSAPAAAPNGARVR